MNTLRTSPSYRKDPTVKHRPLCAICLVVVTPILSGCVATRHYEVDLSHVKNFHWNGKVRITAHDYAPFWGSGTDTIELLSDDGAGVSFNTRSLEPSIALLSEDTIRQPEKIVVRRTNTFWPRQPQVRSKVWQPRDKPDIVIEPHDQAEH